MNRSSIFAAAFCLAALGLAGSPASAALSARAFVSGLGADAAGCGSNLQPCRTFQFVVSNVIAPGGEIDVLNTAGYGPVVITQSLSIVNDNGATAGVGAAAGADSITINAGAGDKIFLKGLTVDGYGVGANGVTFNSGAGLSIDNCIFENFPSKGDIFTGNGVRISPRAGSMTFAITNSIVVNNGASGIIYAPPAGSTAVTNGIIDRVTANHDFNGLYIFSTNSTGVTNVAISNSVVANNENIGITVANGSAGLEVSIDATHVSGSGIGIIGGGAPQILIRRSVVTGNTTGIVNSNSPSSFFSYGDNSIDGNGTNVQLALNPVSLR